MLPKFLSKHEVFKDGKFIQILGVSVCFMLLFTAFQTTSQIAETVLSSARKADPSFSGNGYVSACIIYAMFALSSWLAPSVVAVFSAKWGMAASAAFYVIYIAGFISPQTWFLYLSSLLLGVAAAVLWTAQGNFLTLGSTSKTISRNSGVFWAINSCSLFFGNLFVFYQFHGKEEIDSDTRVFVFIVLTVVSSVGVLCILFLKNLTKGESDAEDKNDSMDASKDSASDMAMSEKRQQLETSSEKRPEEPKKSVLQTAVAALKEALNLSVTKYMLLLSVTSVYTGLGQCFLFGVFSTSIGNTAKFGVDAKRLVGLVGIFIGVGEVVGGTIFGLLGSATSKKGRSPIVFLGLVTHVTCYILIYLNLPNGASIATSDEVSYFNPPIAWLGILCAVLLGFGDACFQTQLFAVFGSVYADKSAAAFAIFKFTQSAASAAGFFYSTFLGLLAQVIIVISFAILGFFSFFYVELKTKQTSMDSEDNNGDVNKDVDNSSKSSVAMPDATA